MASSQQSSQGCHEQERARIAKPSMFMVTALWMERSPLAQRPSERSFEGLELGNQARPNKVGSVIVLPSDRALSVDCSRNDVHGGVIGLYKFGQERYKGCTVYLSRRPCSYCTKLLIQAGVVKVYYLPTEPEVNDPQDIKAVDNLFIVASVGLSPFIPEVNKVVLQELKEKTSPWTPTHDEDAIKLFKEKLKKDHFDGDWIDTASQILQSPPFDDADMVAIMQTNMDTLLEWIAHTSQGDVPDDVEFAEIDHNLKSKPIRNPGPEGASEECPLLKSPVPSEPSWQNFALHMTRLAQMLSQRSDDPIRGVGCVLMYENEVISIGWSGFPAKATYGEFPRRACKKPYIIHAAENAVLTKNQQIIRKADCLTSSAQLYISKIPCRECVHMLVEVGVKHVILPGSEHDDDAKDDVFKEMLQKDKLKGYMSQKKKMPSPPSADGAKRKLPFENENEED
ncbi:cytidine and dCMP deaminase domain-containing protein 1 [Nematostella vectensis]|uniref:cytidine and dCMP deaminase domain-containing protein 1 n=1 Tax=Nematostella vectensis TaxID=45351 RepID=UPI002076E28D|nr:cytidine and dCMP deaminase domain-containing protein 1 [Nematostella vectensis]